MRPHHRLIGGRARTLERGQYHRERDHYAAQNEAHDEDRGDRGDRHFTMRVTIDPSGMSTSTTLTRAIGVNSVR
jgi:hypothetical protein